MTVYVFDPSTKGLRLDALPKEAWTVLSGGRDGDTGDPYEFYKSVPWLFQAVNIRANAVSRMPLRLLNKAGDPVEEPETIFPWWRRLSDLVDGMEADRTLYGRAYLLKQRNRFGVEKPPRRLAPQTIIPDTSEEAGLIGFKRMVGSKELKLTLEEMVYSWTPSRGKVEIGPGVPPAAVALVAAGLIKNADVFASSYFEKGAVNALLVNIEEGGASEAEQNRLQEWIQRKVMGLQNAFQANVGRRKLTVNEIGKSTGDLALPELTDKAREDISTGLGVPHSLLFSNAANYATAEQDTLNFLDYTAVPEAQKIEADLNEQYFEPLGYELQFEPDKLEAYQALEAKKTASVVQLYEADVITRKEARVEMSYDPVVPDDMEDEEEEPEPIPPQLAPGTDPSENPMMIEGQAREVPPQEADLRQWQRKAERRVGEGKPAKAAEFESMHIPGALHAAIQGALEVVGDIAEVQRVFKAVIWQGYP